jgi:hypothetical protein
MPPLIAPQRPLNGKAALKAPKRAELHPSPANRRDAYRHQPRPGVLLSCRRLSSDGEADLFLSFLDVSEGGIRMVLKGRMDEGDQLELPVDCASWRQPKRLLAGVVWAVTAKGGASCVGARFLRRLHPSELRTIAEP